MNEHFLGSLLLFAGNFVPSGWAICDGQLLLISRHQALFSLIGNAYGGDGRSVFALPDLRGRAPIANGQGPGLPEYQLGESLGAVDTTILPAQMPAHTHLLQVAEANYAAPAGNFQTITGGSAIGVAEAVRVKASRNIATQLLSPPRGPEVGRGQPLAIVQPVLGINYIIALQGVYPHHS